MLDDANYEGPSEAMMAALDAFSTAQLKHDSVVRRYRSREITSTEYVVARAEWIEAQEVFAKAFADEIEASD